MSILRSLLGKKLDGENYARPPSYQNAAKDSPSPWGERAGVRADVSLLK